MSLGIEEDNKKQTNRILISILFRIRSKQKTIRNGHLHGLWKNRLQRIIFLTVFIFAVCTLIGILFQRLNFTDTNIVTIYILGVLLTSMVTDGYLAVWQALS